MMFPFIIGISRQVHKYDGTTSTALAINFFWREWFFDYTRPIKKNDKPFEWDKEIW